MGIIGSIHHTGALSTIDGEFGDTFLFFLLRSTTNPTTYPQRRRAPQIRERVNIIEFPHENNAPVEEGLWRGFLSRNTLRSKPISSFPILMANTTLRRRASDPWKALSSWSMRLSARISGKVLSERKASGLVPLEVRRSFGKDSFFLSVFQRSREDQVRTFIFFSSSERVISPFNPRTSRAQRV